jgi:hypothetical protein
VLGAAKLVIALLNASEAIGNSIKLTVQTLSCLNWLIMFSFFLVVTIFESKVA